MAAGPKRERVEILRPARTRRADGGYDTTTTTVATVWAEVVPASAREQVREGRPAGVVSYNVAIRQRSDVTTDDTLNWLKTPALKLNIREIRQPGARDIDMIIVAESGVAL